jgi:hypothetical protein
MLGRRLASRAISVILNEQESAALSVRVAKIARRAAQIHPQRFLGEVRERPIPAIPAASFLP